MIFIGPLFHQSSRTDYDDELRGTAGGLEGLIRELDALSILSAERSM